MTVHPIPPGAYIGRGVDIDLGETYGEALIYDPPQSAIPKDDLDQTNSDLGQSVEFYLTQINNNSQLNESLAVSVSASLGLGAFSGSAEAKYTSQQQINRYSTYLLVSVIVHNPEKVIRNPRLKPEAYKLLENRGWEAFEQTYGPQYLEGIRTGGSYHALIEINTHSKQEQSELAAAVSASYGTFNGEGKFDKKLTEAIENKSIKITVLQNGGHGDIIEVSLEEMIKQAQNFPKLVAKHPVAFQGIFQEYRNTVHLPPNIGEGNIARIHRLGVMQELAHQYLKYKDYRADLRYVLDNFSSFESHLNLEPAAIQLKFTMYSQDFAGVSAQLNAIARIARNCRSSTETCELPKTYFTPTEPLPNFSEENMLLKHLEQRVSTMDAQLKSLSSSAVRPNSSGDISIQGTVKSARGFQFGNYLNLRYAYSRIELYMPTLRKVVGILSPNRSLEIQNIPQISVNGQLGIGTTNPKAALDVKGEIRGTFWHSPEFTWSQGQRPVRMYHKNLGFPVITYIQGGFAGGGERIKTYIADDGYWYLYGGSHQKGMKAKAIFVGRPSA